MRINEITEGYMTPEEKKAMLDREFADPTGKERMKARNDKYAPSPEWVAQRKKEKAAELAKMKANAKNAPKLDIEPNADDDGQGWAKNVEDEGKRRMAQHTAPLRKESAAEGGLEGTSIYVDNKRPVGNYRFVKMLPNGMAQYSTMDNGKAYYFSIDPENPKYRILGGKK